MPIQNKIFSNNQLPNSEAISSRLTINQEQKLLPDSGIDQDLNTYKNFGIFRTWTDVIDQKFTDNKEPGEQKIGTPGVRSIFNKYSTVLTGASEVLNLAGTKAQKEALEKLVLKGVSEFRISNNTPLIDSPEVRKKLRQTSGCSVKELVSASKAGQFGRAVYSYSDFMYCSHLGVVPNNYLITLRRYPVPINDAMMPIGSGKTRLDKAGKADVVAPISTMVTWLGVSGNELGNILKYSYKMAFEEKQAQWTEVSDHGGGTGGILNGLEAAINPRTRALAVQGTGVPALSNFMPKFFANNAAPYTYMGDWRDEGPGKVYGPIDRVKSNYQRSETGLQMTMQFDLTFEYELKAYNGINPRQALLDLLANVFSTTYTTGGFWKGGYRGGGIRQSSIFSNLSIFKQHGTFTGFMDAFSQDLRTHGKEVYSKFTGGGLLETIKTVANAIGGLLIGGLLNKLGRPARYHANSLLSEAPVGLWHITIGNPWHPILSLGNMILTNTEITHTGPLGLDDFPSKLIVKCSFDRGKPKDQVGLEAMYMGGNDRIYHSMSQKVLDMYAASYEYKYTNNSESTKENNEILAEAGDLDTYVSNNQPPETYEQQQNEIKKGLQYLQEVFGDYDAKTVLWGAREQAEGAFPKNKYDEQEAEERRQKALQEAKNKQGKNGRR